jgi:hypothetical protein
VISHLFDDVTGDPMARSSSMIALPERSAVEEKEECGGEERGGAPIGRERLDGHSFH